MATIKFKDPESGEVRTLGLPTLDNVVYVSEANQESAVVPLNADTLGGYTINALTDRIRDDVLSEMPVDEGRVTMTKLWENASPTSAFTGQMISLDLEDGDVVDIKVAGAGILRCQVGNSCQAIMTPGYVSGAGLIVRGRSFNVLTSGVDVSDGGYREISQSGAAASAVVYNTFFIPLAIYKITGGY